MLEPTVIKTQWRCGDTPRPHNHSYYNMLTGHRHLQLLFLGLITVILEGCAYTTSLAPVPLTYPKSWQRKTQAADHWSVLAEYQAGLIIKAINDHDKLLYIDPPTTADTSCGNGPCTPFAQAYYKMLQSHLVKKGANVVTKACSAKVHVSYTAQTLEHQDRDYIMITQEPRSTLASTTRHMTDNSFWSYGGVDPTEVIITTQVKEGHLLLHSSTDIFYYNSGDTGHYFSKHRQYSNVKFKIVDHSGDSNGTL